jgi:hypothetical protein
MKKFQRRGLGEHGEAGEDAFCVIDARQKNRGCVIIHGEISTNDHHL